MSDRAIDPAKVAVVAEREFVATVWRWGYLATLVGMPLLMLVIGLLPALAIGLSGGPSQLLGLPDPEAETRVAVVDPTGIVTDRWMDWHNAEQARIAAMPSRNAERVEIADSLTRLPIPRAVLERAAEARRSRGGFDDGARLTFQRIDDRETAAAAVLDGEVAAAIVLGDDYRRTGRASVLVSAENRISPGVFPGRLATARLIRKSVAERHIDDPLLVDRMVRVLVPKVEKLRRGPEEPTDTLADAIALLLPLLFSGFFTMSIFIASGYLLDGVGEEKESRVLEVLLASLTPEELLLGKMIGLGGAGLLQAVFFALISLIPMVMLGLFSMGVGTLLAMGLAGVLGYALFASLMGASGAVAGNRHEGRQISAVWSLTAASPLFVLPVFLADPGGPFATAISFFPLTAPVGMTMRLGMGDVAAWEAALGYVVMMVSAWFAWRAGSRVFRVALLMSGSRPPLSRIWQWVRGR